MRLFSNIRFIKRFTAAFVLLLVASVPAFSQKVKTQYIMATAMGTSTQMGRIVNIDVIISEYSNDEDKGGLIEAFTSKGSEGLANALDKMHSKGRIRITGTLGYDLNYIRNFILPDGTRLVRFVTDRPVTMGEVWASTRSRDYQITVGEVRIPKDKKKAEGTLFPAAFVKLNKQNEIEIEAFQNPWKLQNIRVK